MPILPTYICIVMSSPTKTPPPSPSPAAAADETAVAAAATAAAVATVACSMKQKPELRYVPAGARFGRFVQEKCPILDEVFAPTWWAGSSLMQTVVPSMLRTRLSQMRYTRELLTCQDGGIVSLDWFEGSPSTEIDQKGSPIALIFPGLIGDSQSEYLRYLVPAIKRLGYRVVTFNNRGRGGMELRTPRIYCAANFDDVELAIDHVRDKNPNSRIVASGFSMGGMVLTRYLAERGEQAKVDAAMLVSANYDLVNGTRHMEEGVLNRFIARVMTKELVSVLLSDKEALGKTDKPVQWEKLKTATSFRELDRYFTCPMWGYADPEDYFKDATNNDRLPKIKVPTLALNSGDDMFSPYETLPLDRLNEAVVFVVTSRGGHLGFMDGWRPTAPYYGDKLVEQYHKAMLEVDSPKELLKPLSQTE